MRSFLRLCLGLIICSSVFAAIEQNRFTAKELAQGFVDGSVLAKPRSAQLQDSDIDEAREHVRLHRRFTRMGNLSVLHLEAGETVPQAITRLRATGRFEYVEPDRILRARTVPNDPSFSTQWSLHNTGQSGGKSGADIGATTAWTTLHDASKVVVGVLDSGIRLTHQDLAGNLWTDPSTKRHGVSATSGQGTISDYDPNDTDVGHGTHVAGIIGALGNNSLGISGVAWKVQLMALRFLHGTDGTGSESDAITCIDYAIAHGAKIINGSYGSPSYSSAEYDAIKAARDAGVIFVAAAGNDTLDTDHGNDYPAGYALDNIVTVAATDRNDVLADYSNYGAGTVDLAAPGAEILSCYNSSDSSYVTFSGTSMATPHVTGALALLRARYPSETYRQIINRLLRGAKKLTGLAGKVQTGGRLSLSGALAATTNRPFNDDFAARATLGGEEVHVRSSNIGATTETGEPTTAGAATLWWTWTATAATTITLDTAGSAYDTKLAVYTGTTLKTLHVVASNDNASSLTTSALSLNVTAGTTYQIAVGSKTSTRGYTALHLGVVPTNDAFAKARLLSGVSIQTSGTTLNGSRETGEPLAVPAAAGSSVWYKWVAPATGHYSLAAFATEIDTVAAVYTGSSVHALIRIAANDNNQDLGNSDTLVSFNATKAQTYYFQIDHYKSLGATGGDFILTLTDSLWEFPTFDEVTSSPATSSTGVVYFGSIDGTIYAINSTGSLKWQYAAADAIDGASPAIGADNTVYIGSSDRNLYALKGGDGTLKWRYTATSAFSSSPAIGSDGIIYFRDDTHLYALQDKQVNSYLKWSYALTGGTGGTYSSPTIGPDGTVYVGTSGGWIYAIKPTGALKWKYQADADIYTSVSISSSGVLYFATLDGRLYALKDAGSKATKWWSRTISGGKSITSSIAIAKDGTLYFGSYDHELHSVTAAGTDKWTYSLGDEVRASSPAIGADGTVYVGCYNGLVYAVSTTGKLVRTYATALKIRSSPLIVGTRLYIGSSDAKLHAWNIGQGPQSSAAWPMFQADRAHSGRSTASTASVTAKSAETKPTTTASTQVAPSINRRAEP